MNKELGKIIHDRRVELRLYLKDIAKICDVSNSTVSRWENGETDGIKRGNLYLLSQALYIPIEVLLGLEEPSKIEDVSITIKKEQLITLINKINDTETLEKIGQILSVLVPSKK